MKFIIYFEDLNEETQEAIIKDIKENIHDYMDIDTTEMSEDEIREAILDYINAHNFANEFIL